MLQDMTRLRELWPVEVFDQMKSRQQDLELMRKSAKRNYQQVRPCRVGFVARSSGVICTVMWPGFTWI